MTDKERFKAIFETQVMREGAEKLVEWLESTDFFEAPASTRFHGTYPGGLVAHSLRVYDNLVINQDAMEYSGEAKAICALLHDLCKVNYYHRDGDGWTVRDALPMGHGEKSVYLIQKHMSLTDEEALAIRWHMGAYDEAFRCDTQRIFGWYMRTGPWRSWRSRANLSGGCNGTML